MDMILNDLVTVVNHLGRGFWGHAAAMFVQSGILILLLLIIDFLLRRRVKAVFRYCLWMLVFAKLVLPTSFAFPTGVGYWLGEWWPSERPLHERMVSAEQSPPIVLAEQPLAPHLVGPLPEPAMSDPAATVPAETSEPMRGKVETLHWQVWLFLFWAAGALAFASLLIRRTNSVKRLLAESAEADEGLKDLLDRCRGRVGLTRNVQLRLSSRMVSPAVCGLVRPTILLPRRAVTKLPADKLRLVLIHELVHINRWDVWLSLVQAVLQVIYFYNPLLWLANARIRRLREQAVDETVLAAFGKQADSYSDMLLDIAEMAFRRPNLSLRLVGVVESKKALGRRIQHIMRRPIPKSAKVGAVGLAAIVLTGAVLLPMAKAGKPAVLRVAADGSAPYTSIQRAIDAAPEGAVIRVAPGMYEERLKINKPLTLEGAGWDKTTITAENAMADEFENMRRLAMQQVRAAKSEEEAKRMGSEFEAELAEKFASMQTVLVHDAKRVAISNLKLTSPGRQLEGRTLAVPVLEFRNAKAQMSGCVIAGNPGNGIHVTDGSDVEIRDSLVAGVWGTGIVVGRKGGEPCSVRILDSDLRNCHYAGIVIRPGNDSTSIQRCRISGAAWHGIRYDSASPTIVGNLVFGNARCGIYASGKTTATVKQNLFYGNEMTGISCWFQNQDIIEQNSFVGNKRSGLEVLGASKPIVRKNILYANPTGVSRGNIGSDSPFAESDGVITLQDNLFWQNERNVVRRRPATAGAESTTEDISLNEQAHNVQADPLFVSVEGRDFALAPNSPTRRSGVGAADPVGFDSPWPLQDEEIAIIPEGDTRDWREWKKEALGPPPAERPAISRKSDATSIDLPDIALLYHSDPEVRIQTVKTLAASADSGLIDDLIRAHCVENYTPVHNVYGQVLRSLTGQRNVRGKGAWKAWLASEAKANHLKIAYFPVTPDRSHQGKIAPFALEGPDSFSEMAAILTAKIYDRRKCYDALRYMVFNDHLPEVKRFLSGDWLSRLFAHQNININDIGYFLNGLANPGPLRKQVNTQVRGCLDSGNPTVVANALNLIAGVEGFSTRFTVPGVEDKVEDLISSSVPEVAVQARRAITTIRPSEERLIRSEASKVVSVVKGNLQRMIDSAQPGGTVLMPKGVYTEPIEITKPLTLKGQSRTDCIFEVTANRPAIFVDAKNKGEVAIEDITVKWQLATTERCEYPVAVAVKDTTAKVRNCCFLPLGNFKRCPVAINSVGFSKLNIDTCRFEGFEFTVSFGPGTEGTIQDCLLMDSGHQGISLYSGTNASIIGNIVTGSKFHAVRSTGGTLHMKDNLIIENANRGVYLGNRSASGTIANNVILGNGTGISGFARSNVKIENNIIADSSYAGIGMRSSCSLLIRNNILKHNQRALIMFVEVGSSGNRIDRNLFWQNATDTENVDRPASSIMADPLFVDAEHGDFSLRPGPAMEHKQGLTNPRVFRVLWQKWKNRADKNQPFIGETVPTKVADGDKSSESSEIGKQAADKPGGTGYAWQGTDQYIPPDFEGFFPDDLEGSKELQLLWQSSDRDQRPDAEILSIVRRGFRRYQGDRGDIVRWIGNRYIWGKMPQNPEAIEIMYHASDIADHGTSSFAVYFGLSVVRSKTPAILRRLADMGMRSDDPNLLGRIAWGCSSQKEQLLAYLQPRLKSDQQELRAKAEVFARIIRGELDAFRWAGEKRRAKRYAELIKQMPEYKGTSIEELISKHNGLVVDLTEESARYRASSPVFEEYANLTRKFVVPWGLQGEKARLKLVELVEKEPEFWKTVEYDQEVVQDEIGKILGPLYKDIAAHMRQLEFYDTFVRALDQQGTINVNATLHVATKYGDTGEIRDPYANPFEQGSWQHVHFERDVGGALMMLHAAFGTILAKLPPTLEKRKEEALQLYELIANHPSTGDTERAAKYVDAYVDSLEKEYKKIGQYTEQYWKERKQKEREAKPAESVSETAAATTYEEAFVDLYEELGRNYPCFELKGIDWKKVAEELLPRAKDVRTDKEFGLLCMELVARLEDSHAYLMKGTAEVPEVSFPRWDPGFACLMDDREKPVVYHVDRGGPAEEARVKVGMTVLSVNGEPVDEYMQEQVKQIKKYSGYSSERYLRYHAAQWLGRQMDQGATVELKMQDVGGQTRTFELPATLGVRYLPRRPIQVPGTSDTADVAWTELSENIGYIYVRRIRGDLIEKLDQAVGELKNARGLIVDVRGNSGGGFDSRRSHRNFAPEDKEEPDRPRFGGVIALLIDSRCISAGEGWASWFVANKRARMFGEATAGASSRKTVYTLANGLFKVQYPVKAYRGYLDRPIERRGLEPDVLVRQNAGDLAAGRDTVLEMAKRYLLGQ